MFTLKLLGGVKNYKLSTDKLILFSYILLTFVSLFGTQIPFQGNSYEEIFEQETTNISNQITFSFLFFVSLIPISKRFQEISSFILKEKYLSLFIIFCISSAIWSDYSFISVKRSFQLLVTFLVLLNAVLFLNYKNLLQPLKFLILLYLIVNFFSCLIIPEAIDSSGAWKGIYGHKNGLAQSTYFIFLASTLVFNNRSNKLVVLIKVLIFIICCVLIFNAKSSMVIIVFILTITYWIIRGFLSIFVEIGISWFLLALLVLFVIIIGIILFSSSPEFISVVPQIFGKDLSISGRDQIWLFVLSEIQNRPFLGYGFGTYWIMGSTVIDVFAANFGGFKINQAHNGYLEILLQVGIIGFFFFLILIIISLYRAVKIKNDFSIIILLSLLVINYTESILFQPKGLSTFILILVYFILTKQSFKKRVNLNEI